MERDDARQGSDLPVWEDALAPLRLKLETDPDEAERETIAKVEGPHPALPRLRGREA